MSDVLFSFCSGGSMVIRESGAENICRLDELSALTGGVFSPASGDVVPAVDILVQREPGQEDGILIMSWQYGKLYYVPENRSCRFFPNRKIPLTDRMIVLIWRICVLAAAYIRVLNQKKVMILHGAALKIHHQVLLICGQSGMGKSTTAARWKACGEEVLCDDLMLLEQTPEGVAVHPLPTWSRCMSSLQGEDVNFSETCSIRSVVALSRSMTGVETLEEADKIVYYSTVYSSCCAFLSFFIKQLPRDRQLDLRSAAVYWADLLTGGEKKILCAELNGNLKETLKSYY